MQLESTNDCFTIDTASQMSSLFTNTCPFVTNVTAVGNVGKGVLRLDAGVPVELVQRPHLHEEQPLPGSVGLCL